MSIQIVIKMDNIPGLAQKVQAEVATVVQDTANLIVDLAKQIVPVDTGNLRDSIQAEVDETGMNAVVSTDVNYAPFVEFGTVKMAAQPFLTPAAEAAQEVFISSLQNIGANLR